ncbi:GNAT superfamily N-acetyltransferase [Streptomyces sp. 3330]|uniref:GNAT family N-acetyltransferase n=1 Tax=Streptomyces sp. 3330 TaxID=2817755 RepID=UPI0028563B78|nr:GNAT family N-acetyltransferase [Streptomyces sp. 3330]MDR6981001.1 GNAT superfamily N-acetyltransferase [Streptomyces sp. 3330]
MAEIQVVTWRQAYSEILSAEELEALDVDRSADFWREQVASSTVAGTQLLVAQSSDQVVGFSSFGPVRDEDLKGDRVMELYALYVHPSLWSAGVGHALMSATAQYWSEQGVAEATLWVFERNDRARTFYERSGWRLDERVRPTGEKPAELEVRYRLQARHI